MTFNRHYITYPLLIIGAILAIYYSGQYHQRKADRERARADSISTQAQAIIKAKALADSVARDSILALETKVALSKQATKDLEKQREVLGKKVLAAKDTAQLVSGLLAQLVIDSSTIQSLKQTVNDQSGEIVYLHSVMKSDSIKFDALAKLNTDTNQRLTKAIADANPGLVSRVIKNLDVIGGVIVVCHFTKC